MAKWKEPTCLATKTDYADLCARLLDPVRYGHSEERIEAAAAIRDLEAELMDLDGFLEAKHKSWAASKNSDPANCVSGYSIARDKLRAALRKDHEQRE